MLFSLQAHCRGLTKGRFCLKILPRKIQERKRVRKSLKMKKIVSRKFPPNSDTKLWNSYNISILYSVYRRKSLYVSLLIFRCVSLPQSKWTGENCESAFCSYWFELNVKILITWIIYNCHVSPTYCVCVSSLCNSNLSCESEMICVSMHTWSYQISKAHNHKLETCFLKTLQWKSSVWTWKMTV